MSGLQKAALLSPRHQRSGRGDRTPLRSRAGATLASLAVVGACSGGCRAREDAARCGLDLAALRSPRASARGPLRRSTDNPRYFEDDQGRLVFLAGSHTWKNLQDVGDTRPPQPFDYGGFLEFLVRHNHNFFRLWAWEQARWTPDQDTELFFIGPHAYPRLGPGTALDGAPRFDLSCFDQAYFDRLRSRVRLAGLRGLYVSVMLFNGWSVSRRKGDFAYGNPWFGHPYNAANNVNGIDGDPDHDMSGEEVHTLKVSRVTALQKDYVQKVVETVGDLDNVLFEISNESHVGSADWQYEMLDWLRRCESSFGRRHPVGMTVPWPGGSNEVLYESDADWVSPAGDIHDRPTADGRKVVVADTDHLCGVCGDVSWVWESFTRGENLLFMDGNDNEGKLWAFEPDTKRWEAVRRNLGYARYFAERIDLRSMTPQSRRASTGYCLANPAGREASFLVYVPTGSTEVRVDLTGASGRLAIEWFDPSAGVSSSGSRVEGGAWRRFTPPWSGPAVLFVSGAAP